jgi:hypothetical protein
MSMRKTISTTLATALLLFGLWWTWEWLTAPALKPQAAARALRIALALP